MVQRAYACGAILNVILCCIQRTLMCSEYRSWGSPLELFSGVPLADYSDIIES